jgi:hypothetical protein
MNSMRRRVESSNCPGSVPKIALAAGLGLALLPAPALAGTLSSAFLLSADAASVICHISNLGAAPAVITSSRIFDFAGNDITSSETCGTLSPGRTCLVLALLDGGDGARGIAEVAGSTKKVRAVCQVLDPRGLSLEASEMR